MEDDELLLIRALKEYGYDTEHKRVETPEDLEKALKSEEWDVVISDYVLPCMNGLEALQMFKESGLDVPFILVSGTVGEDVAVAALKAGAHDYLMKDRMTRLGTAVDRAIADASERVHIKRTQERLKETESKYRTLFKSAADAIMVVAFEGKESPVIIDCNDSTLKMFGCDRKDFLGKNIEDVSAPIQPGGGLVYASISKMSEELSRGKSLRGEWIYRRQNGELFHADITLSSLMFAGATHALVIVRDITERIKAEAALRKAEKEWQRTFDAIEEFIFVQDKDYIITRVNKSFLDVMKLEKEDVIGKKCYEVVHARTSPWPNCPFEQTKSDKKTHTEEVDDPNIGFPISVTTSPIFDSEGNFNGSVHIAKDMSALRTMIEEKEKHAHELEVFFNASMGREDKILELKQKVAELEEQLE